MNEQAPSKEFDLSVEQDARAHELWDNLNDDDDTYAIAQEVIYLRDKLAAQSAHEPPASLWGDGTREMLIQLRDWLKSKMPCPAGDCCNELRGWVEKVDQHITFHAPAASAPPPGPDLQRIAKAAADIIRREADCGVPAEYEREFDALRDALMPPRATATKLPEPCGRCGGSGRLTIFDTPMYIGQICAPIGDEPCPACSSEGEAHE